ncbi:HSP90-like protein, related, related [Eimeria maxima]|uniref:HSP90-like protein, related, related n=1 Tax=Eimeria maxima TaxID=5804 RepID=U6MIM4_EIMMA|nr:HSP90-like protein, related, related [Eimeria maxima]CDJ61505.1 HSP90-like protein, related, related [Eimeria maxima]
MQFFIKKGYEVLFLLEPMEEPCIQRLQDFDGKKFESIQKANITLEETEEEKKRHKRIEKRYKPLIDWYKRVLGFDVDEPAQLADLLYKGIATQIGVDPNDPINQDEGEEAAGGGGEEEEEEEEEKGEKEQGEDNDYNFDGKSAEDLFSNIDLAGAGLKDEL